MFPNGGGLGKSPFPAAERLRFFVVRTVPALPVSAGRVSTYQAPKSHVNGKISHFSLPYAPDTPAEQAEPVHPSG